MPEERHIEYCVLNIAASPHPDDVYRSLLEDAASHQVNFWGDSFAAISKPVDVEDGYLRGRIFCWTLINEDEPAVRTDTLEEVDFSDLKINIPDNVGFNGRVFTYILRIKDHKLFVEVLNDLGKRLSPQRAKKIFSMLFDALAEAPFVEVTVIPEEDALRRILSLPKLRQIHIHLVRPNADDADTQRVMDRLIAQKARSQDVKYVAAPGPDGLELDELTKTEAEVAEQNGYVDGSGLEDDGSSIKLSTRQYPRVFRRIVGQFGSAFEEGLALAKEAFFRPPGG